MGRGRRESLTGLDVPTALASGRPKGDQIREIIESLAERLGAGAPLPSERAVAEHYGVARMTVRAEYRRLESDGLVRVRPGAGAYVADESRPPRLVGSSFSRDMRARGKVPGGRVVEHAVFEASPREAQQLGVPSGARLFRVVRVRTADGEPVALERTTLPLTRFPGLEAVDLADSSLYDVLRDRWGVEPRDVRATATAGLPSADEARLLGIPVETPCMVVQSLQRGADGQVIETGRAVYRGDRYDLDVSYRLST